MFKRPCLYVVDTNKKLNPDVRQELLVGYDVAMERRRVRPGEKDMSASERSGSQTPLLELVGIDKSFPGVKALSGINLKVMPGKVHVICGENGAGKSTLVKIAYSGEISHQ